MLSEYKKSGAALFIRKIMLNMKKMKVELNEHRYYLERNVEQRTEHLLKHIAVLESCNAALCDKLILVQRDHAALQPASHGKDAETNARRLKLYVMNNHSQELIGSNVQGILDAQAAAA
jgi:hypothetical protein